MAVRRLGVVDTIVIREHEPPSAHHVAGGVWYWLRVLLVGRTEWTPVARRRTKAELLGVASTLDPRDVEGKRVR